jgi:membrane protease YdiL (CAAX protease family)
LGFALLGAFILFTLTSRWSAPSGKQSDGEGFQSYVSGVFYHRLSFAIPEGALASAVSKGKDQIPFPERSLKSLRKAVADVPESAHFKRYLAVVQAESGDFAGARKTLDAAMKIVSARAPARGAEERAAWHTLYSAPNPTPADFAVAGKRLEGYGLGWLARAATLAAHSRPGAPPAPAALQKGVRGEAVSYVITLAGSTIAWMVVLPLLGLITLGVGSALIRTGVLRPVTGISHPVAAPLLEGFILMLACNIAPAFLAFGGARPAPESQPGLYALLFVVGDFLQLTALLYLALRLLGRSLTLAEIGLTRQHLGANILIGVLAALILTPAAQALGLATQQLSDRLFPNVAPPYHPLSGMTATSTHPAIRGALFFAAVVGAPILEEIFFRGGLFGSLRRRFRFWPAALLSSAVFAILHPQLPLGFIPIAALAIGFSALMEWRRSLVPGMVAHAVNNGIAFLMMSLLFPPGG